MSTVRYREGQDNEIGSELLAEGAWWSTIRLHQRIVSIMRTTVTLDDDVYEAARAQAQATGKRLGTVLSEMARHALQPSGKRPDQSAKKASRFPVFEIPAGARPISASRIQKALEESGIF